MTVTPQLIRELREKTGVGMGKCKEALVAAEGNLEEAINHLRKAGMAAAVKKEGREAKEGLVAFSDSSDSIILVEINAETDFAANNDVFKAFVQSITEELAHSNPEGLEAFLAQPYSKDPSISIDEYRATIVQKIGENIQIRRLQRFAKSGDSSLGVYSHMGGKLVTLVDIAGSADEVTLAKDIAMHVAAENPEFVSRDQVPQEIVDREREIAREQVKNKPENIIEKIVDGKLNAYYDQFCLVCQKFIKDPAMSIEKLVDGRSKESGKDLTVASFVRWRVGQ